MNMASGDSVSITDKRLRTLTEKGTDLFENTCCDYEDKLSKLWNQIDTNIELIESEESGSVKRSLKQQLETLDIEHDNLATEYMQFLQRTNTLQSLKRFQKQETLNR